MINDFINNTDCHDNFHNNDYIQSAIEKHGWQRSFHEKYPVSYPYMHFHVFDENNVKELFELIFEDVHVDVLKNEKHSDVLVVVKNILNSNFVSQYREIIEGYSEYLIN
jgi:hypothetical protein